MPGISFAAGLVIVVLNAAVSMVLPAVLRVSARDAVATVNLLQGARSAAAGGLALIAVITGGLALARRVGNGALAGAGVALGGSALVGLAVTLLQGLTYSVLG